MPAAGGVPKQLTYYPAAGPLPPRWGYDHQVYGWTPDGKRVRLRPQRPDTQYDEEVHLFSPISFLDDGWHQRTYWIYGRAAGEGWAEFQLPPDWPYARLEIEDADGKLAWSNPLWCSIS